MDEECREVETELSYVRRLAQARIDIIRAEIDRRAAGGSLGDLIAALPEILADDGAARRSGRQPPARAISPPTSTRSLQPRPRAS